jgi:hypothetical protein
VGGGGVLALALLRRAAPGHAAHWLLHCSVLRPALSPLTRPLAPPCAPRRSQGRDHIWLFSHDEGACWAPTELYNNSIILTHWGRMDPDHTSGTAFHSDK